MQEYHATSEQEKNSRVFGQMMDRCSISGFSMPQNYPGLLRFSVYEIACKEQNK